MAEVKSSTVCTKCGALYGPDAKYCGSDGSALQLVVQAQPRATGSASVRKYCPTCRMIFPAHAQFCAKDATKLADYNEPASDEKLSRSVTPAGVSDSHTALHAAPKIIGLLEEEEEPAQQGQEFAGKYLVESLLGEGGMARVYLARHIDIDKPVVIKLMHNNISYKEKTTALKRFVQEIKVSAQLNHPNLVSVFDGGVIDGRPYLVMEYIQGKSLRQFMTDTPKVSFRDAINIVAQACAGLQEAHRQGIIHRDMKPENIMLREQKDRPDWVKVVDFGIANLKQGGMKLTATGVAIGTVDYMSPEYLSDKPVDHRADVYALGIILYELLTKHCPFESEATEAVLAKHLFSDPLPPSYHRHPEMVRGCALDRVTLHALEKEPADRFQSADELRRALFDCLSNPNG